LVLKEGIAFVPLKFWLCIKIQLGPIMVLLIFWLCINVQLGPRS